MEPYGALLEPYIAFKGLKMKSAHILKMKSAHRPQIRPGRLHLRDPKTTKALKSLIRP